MSSSCVRSAVFAVLCMASMGQAMAGDNGWYAGVLVGTTGHASQTLRLEGTAPEVGRSEFSSDFLSGAHVGYRWRSGWRVEGEFTYQSVDRDNQLFTAASLQGAAIWLPPASP